MGSSQGGRHDEAVTVPSSSGTFLRIFYLSDKMLVTWYTVKTMEVAMGMELVTIDVYYLNQRELRKTTFLNLLIMYFSALFPKGILLRVAL